MNMQGNDAMRPIFEKWLEPFKDLGASTIALRLAQGDFKEDDAGPLSLFHPEMRPRCSLHGSSCLVK